MFAAADLSPRIYEDSSPMLQTNFIVVDRPDAISHQALTSETAFCATNSYHFRLKNCIIEELRMTDFVWVWSLSKVAFFFKWY
jgi:hypothetical protein